MGSQHAHETDVPSDTPTIVEDNTFNNDVMNRFADEESSGTSYDAFKEEMIQNPPKKSHWAIFRRWARKEDSQFTLTFLSLGVVILLSTILFKYYHCRHWVFGAVMQALYAMTAGVVLDYNLTKALPKYRIWQAIGFSIGYFCVCFAFGFIVKTVTATCEDPCEACKVARNATLAEQH